MPNRGYIVPWWYPGLAIGLIDYVTNKYLLDEEDPVEDPQRPLHEEIDHSLFLLPDDVEAAILNLVMRSRTVGVSADRYKTDRGEIKQDLASSGEAENQLRQAIRRLIYDAKSEVFVKSEKVIGEFMDRNKDLRERAERMRKEITWWTGAENPRQFIREGDLDDNLQPPVATADPNGD